MTIAVRPDPALTSGDFGDGSPPPAMRRGDVVWALLLVTGLLVWFGLKLAAKHGVGLAGPSEPMAVVDATPYRLDLNAADWPEFMQLPGIGETLARRIVADRDANGRFASVADLSRVRGIGPATVEKVRGNVLDPLGERLAISRPRGEPAASDTLHP